MRLKHSFKRLFRKCYRLVHGPLRRYSVAQASAELAVACCPGVIATMSERKAVVKNADMSEDMQRAAIDCATRVSAKIGHKSTNNMARTISTLAVQEVPVTSRLLRRGPLWGVRFNFRRISVAYNHIL